MLVAAAVLALAAAAVAVLETVGGSAAGPRRAAAATAAARSPFRGGRHGALRRRSSSAAESTAIRRLLGIGLPIYCAGHHGDEVAFTFDDGPGPYTHYALRKLASSGEQATFFVVGRSMDAYPGYLPRELKVAAIGDHTYTHPALIALSPSGITWQLQATARKIERDSGAHVELFRPPYELHDATVDRIAQRLGLLEILWDVDSQDSLGANYAQIIENVEAGLHPGAIIEMHENRGQTIRALTTLLPELRRRHLRSVSVPQLLANDPPSPAQVRRGRAGCVTPGAARRPGSE